MMKTANKMSQLSIGDKFLARCSYFSPSTTRPTTQGTCIERRVVMDFSENRYMIKLRPDYWLGSWFSSWFAEWIPTDTSYVVFLDKFDNEKN